MLEYCLSVRPEASTAVPKYNFPAALAAAFSPHFLQLVSNDLDVLMVAHTEPKRTRPIVLEMQTLTQSFQSAKY